MHHLQGAVTAKLHMHEDDVLALKRVGAINKEQYNKLFFFFHSCTVHLDIIKVFYLPTDAQ